MQETSIVQDGQTQNIAPTKPVLYSFQADSNQPHQNCYVRTRGKWDKNQCVMSSNKDNEKNKLNINCACDTLGPTTVFQDLKGIIDKSNL